MPGLGLCAMCWAGSLSLGAASPAGALPGVPGDGIQAVGNAQVQATPQGLLLQATTPGAPMTLRCTPCDGVGLEHGDNQWWTVPTQLASEPVKANSGLWLLPADPNARDHAWYLTWQGGEATVTKDAAGLTVAISAGKVSMAAFEARPHSDVFGHRYQLHISRGAELEQALAAFYWGTMVPSVVERTFAAHFPYSSGYVLSTLNTRSYAGSYPAVDHEFQIRGRLAMGSAADLDTVRRMIELQFKLMDDDPEQLARSPTSVQPDGRREYHIRRDSKDARENAAMFPVTGNIEVVEESWAYYQARKDVQWLRSHIADLEHAAGWTLASVDQYGRLWSDVYYEDQVIKDGRETEAQAFAAYSYHLLAHMEQAAGAADKAAFYEQTAKKMEEVLRAPLPQGYWNEKESRFVDWVDRNGVAHDHLHLVANTAPVTLGYATPSQASSVRALIEKNQAEFERFPSFVAADIGAYTSSEMGTAGPYDLSAAGRYWYWDAAYRASQHDSATLLDQLGMVADEGKRNGYFMGERYDMDHVYYIDGKNAHGAEKYYEYPNVFAAVLIGQYLGLSQTAEADLAVAPHLDGDGEVELDTPAYAVRYACNAASFTLKNLSDRPRRFLVDLSARGPRGARYSMSLGASTQAVAAVATVTLAPQQEARWTVLR